MAPSSTFREADLPTAWSEEGARTIDAGPVTGLKTGDAAPAPGDVLKNRFVLQECLAHGPHSRLFRARDLRREAAGDADSLVALKIVTAGPGREPRALQALRREAAIAQGLTHPNLPRIVGIDHEGPHTFLCMEWLEGESLATILDSRGARPMTRVQALHIIGGVCRALTHVHGQGITHADVKPGNILISPDGDATLLDFGVSLGPGAGDLPAVRGHTPEYASPQVLAGAEPTPADDLFSVACVAYRMLKGHRAFGVGNARDAEAAGMRPPQPESLSPVQWRALNRALAFARTERQPDVAMFLAQVKGARDESTAVTDLSGGKLESSAPRGRGGVRDALRFWPLAAVVVVVVVVVSMAAGALVFLFREPAPPTVPATGARESQEVPASPPAASPIRRDGLPPPVAIPAEPPRQLAPPPPPEPTARRSVPAPSPRVRPTSPARVASPPAAEPDPAPTAAATTAATTAVETPGALPDTAVVARSVPFSSLAVRRLVEPDYPRKAASRRVSGWVDVMFRVDASGRTQDVRVRNADPPGVFDDAALDAVRRWRFKSLESGAAEGSVSSEIRLRFDPRKTR